MFAIAMTLLVLDLGVDELGNPTSSADLLNALGDMESKLISFTISFLLIGGIWAVHMRQFEYIEQADRRLTMINTLRLLMVVLIPLTTSIAGEFPDLVLGRMLFPINFFFLLLLGVWQWAYAAGRADLCKPDLTPGVRQVASARNRTLLVLSALVVPLSAWIGSTAFALLLLTPLVIRLFLREQASSSTSAG